MNYVCVVTAVSAGKEKFGPFVFAKEPTEAQRKALILNECDWSGGVLEGIAGTGRLRISHRSDRDAVSGAVSGNSDNEKS